MGEYLTFLLAAPLGSFGEVAPGERRGSAPTPTRSAVLGLVAAALGLEREAHAALEGLTRGYGVARAMLDGASPLLDYHTVQNPRPADLSRFARRQGRSVATRAEAMEAGEPTTLLTRRDYWCDVAVLVALWARTGAPYALEEIAQALRTPRFVLYLGRKSCPLMLPVRPGIVAAPDARAAICAIAPAADLWGLSRDGRRWDRPPREVALDADDPAAEAPEARTSDRRDLSRHHPAWLFEPRREVTVPALWPAGAGAS